MPNRPASRPAKNQNVLNRWLNRYFPAVIALALVAFFLFSYLMLIGPKLLAIKEMVRSNLEQEQMIYEASRRKLANLDALATMYEKIKPADLQKFSLVLPDNYPPEKLFGELEEIVSRGGWTIDGITVADETEAERAAALIPQEDLEKVLPVGSANEKVGRIKIELSISSIDYPGFKQLVKMIETNLRLFDIVQVGVVPDGDLATLSLVTYYYKYE